MNHLSSLDNSNKNLLQILTEKNKLTDNEKKKLKRITNSIKNAGPEIYRKVVQLSEGKVQNLPNATENEKKTKKLELKRGVGRSIKNRLINSLFFKRKKINKKVISGDKITNNEIKHHLMMIWNIFLLIMIT